MQVQPAHIDQVAATENGHMVAIDADVGGVAAELKRIDKGLKVRFATPPGRDPYWVVFHDDGQTQNLVLTAKAWQTHSGVWAGLDHRIVARVREIDAQSRSGYDFVKELDGQRERRDRERKRQFADRVGEIGELAAHMTRKDLGERYKGRAFVPRDVPA